MQERTGNRLNGFSSQQNYWVTRLKPGVNEMNAASFLQE